MKANGRSTRAVDSERFLQLAVPRTISGVAMPPPRRRTSISCDARRSSDPRRPLVVMTPKGLLRLKDATSTRVELSEGAFSRRSTRTWAPSHDALGGSSSAPGRSISTSSATRTGSARTSSPSLGSSSSTRSPSSRLAACCAAIRISARSSGHRRSRRTWVPGGRSATGSRRRSRKACRSCTSGARGARARARAIRPRTCASRTGSSARR